MATRVGGALASNLYLTILDDGTIETNDGAGVAVHADQRDPGAITNYTYTI
jgi:hypothetical protein